ncbi:MAG TPA: hypothetical protein VF792_04460 [Ktedonobacterales bacterium]
MTTPADGSSRLDDAATNEAPDAVNGSNGSSGTTKTRAAKEKRTVRPNAGTSRVTAQLPAIDADMAEQKPAAMPPAAPYIAGFDDQDDGATQEVPAAPSFQQTDPDATILRAQPRPNTADLSGIDDEPMTEPAPPRQRYHTLADTFNRPRTANSSEPMAPAPRPPYTPSAPMTPPEPFTPLAQSAQYAPEEPIGSRIPESDFFDDDGDDGIVDEVDSDDEWALADQPTVQWTPQQIAEMQQLKPDFPDFLQETGGQAVWPPQQRAPQIAAEIDTSHVDWQGALPPRPRPPFPLQGAPRPMLGGDRRLAAPDGRLAPAPPSASHAGEQLDPRMERFQELRRQRFAHDQGERDEADPQPVAESMRQWWNDLRPGVNNALNYQREARASGMHPIPAYESAQTSRLGDAFGRLAASAREISERAQQAAAPTIKRLHDQVEQAAQGLISRFEGDTVRQQAPLLGPGRIAVFFRQGVSVGQAQRLLAASAARPMRLIPRKHGFLARVLPGKEAEVCERLRMHPYVRDVVYLEFNEYGEQVGGRR